MKHKFTWHLHCHWHWKRWQRYHRDYYLDGGSVEWTLGPFTLEKRIHWLR